MDTDVVSHNASNTAQPSFHIYGSRSCPGEQCFMHDH